MKLLKLILLLSIIFSCKEKKIESENYSSVKNESKNITQDKNIDSANQNHKQEKVDKSYSDLIFDRVEVYKSVSKEYSNQDSIPSEFKNFTKKFITDETFQIEHIDFGQLLAAKADCLEFDVLSKDNWEFYKWNFIDLIGIDDKDENIFYFSDSVFYFQYTIKEIGTHKYIGFEKKDEKWVLTLYFQNDC